jgi:hypothetical protein
MKLLNTTELLESLFTEQSRPSKRTWKRRVEDGLIPHTRIGGRLYYVLAEVQQALSNHQNLNQSNPSHEA